MAELKERQYKAKGAKRSPFLPSKISAHGPSGSTWGLQHLNWLKVHFAVGYNPKELFSSESELPESSQIATHLQHKLGAGWKWICYTEHPSSLSIYAFFQRLIYERREDDEYRTATQASTNPNSPSSSGVQSLHSSTSPQQPSQSTTSHKGI